MAIYQLFEQENKREEFSEIRKIPVEKLGSKNFFSTLVTRLCFFLLLLADSLWFVYNTALLLLCCSLSLLTLCRWKKGVTYFALQFRRSALCALALFVGLFSPPFGIMVACTYFLMYDKEGMEAVVPTSLQSQFKDMFKAETP